MENQIISIYIYFTCRLNYLENKIIFNKKIKENPVKTWMILKLSVFEYLQMTWNHKRYKHSGMRIETAILFQIWSSLNLLYELE